MAVGWGKEGRIIFVLELVPDVTGMGGGLRNGARQYGNIGHRKLRHPEGYEML